MPRLRSEDETKSRYSCLSRGFAVLILSLLEEREFWGAIVAHGKHTISQAWAIDCIKPPSLLRLHDTRNSPKDAVVVLFCPF